jgi:hypothetical protein
MEGDNVIAMGYLVIISMPDKSKLSQRDSEKDVHADRQCPTI